MADPSHTSVTNATMFTTIHNWLIQPFSQYYDLDSHTIHVLIVSINRCTYSLKTIPNDSFLRKFTLQFYLLSEFLPKICWEEINEEIFFFFLFWCLNRDLNRGLTSNKPTHYLRDYGDLVLEFIVLEFIVFLMAG